jgi:hypothetical protein
VIRMILWIVLQIEILVHKSSLLDWSGSSVPA